jgi:hypothetical protein
MMSRGVILFLQIAAVAAAGLASWATVLRLLAALVASGKN